MLNKQLRKGKSFLCSRVSARHFLCTFCLLAVFMVYNLTTTFVVDVTMKMKSDMFDVNGGLVNLTAHNLVNGTFSTRSYTSKAGHVADNQTWVNKTEFETKPKTIPALNTTSKIKDVIPVSTSSHKKTDKTADTVVVNNKTEKQNVSDDNRKDSCSGCFFHNFSYVIDNENICKLTFPEQTIQLVILIFTTHGNIKQRNAIRSTWLKLYENNTFSVRYAFLLGEIKDSNLQQQVLEENKLYRDIIKEDFVDSYMNLTYKTIMGFKWASTKCAHAQYVMKTDDDMFVNVPNVIQISQNKTSFLQGGIVGACTQLAGPIRDKNSKWYASVKSYPNSHYPGFCSGTGYVTSMQVARKVYEVSPNVPFFHLEDVYVALCIKKLGLRLTGIKGFNSGKPPLDPCKYKGTVLVTSHQLPPTELQLIWNGECREQTRS